MTTNPPTQMPLTLFDASQFEFRADCTAKTPARPSLKGLGANDFAVGGTARRVPSAEAAQARRRRARARLAKRRYLADIDGYERIEQARQALQLVAD